MNTDGEFRDHELDLSSVPGWTGTIVSLRLDPVTDAGRMIEIDRIGFVAG